MLPALSPTQTVSRSDGKRSASPDCRIQWHRYRAIAAIHQQNVCLSHPADPAFFVDAGQRGELEHAQGLPTQLAHGRSGLLSADEPPCMHRTGHGVTVRGGGDTQGAGLGNGFTQQINQSVVDARVFDASGGEKKFHDGFLLLLNGPYLCENEMCPPGIAFRGPTQREYS